MTDRPLSIRSPEALKAYGRDRLTDADAVEGMRAGLESTRVPRWALGGLDPESDLMGRRLDAYWDHRSHELDTLRRSLTGQGRSLARVVEAIDEQDALNAMTLLRMGPVTHTSVALPETIEDETAEPTRVPVTDPTANPKAGLVEHRVELPGWQEPTYRYTDPDGEAFDLPAPGLPPVQVGVSTSAAFHDFSISTESNDDLERVMARYGRQLEEAELIGRAMGSDHGVLGPYVLPLWLSSPEAIDGVAERLASTVTRFDRDVYDGYGRAVRGIEGEWSGAAQQNWRAHAGQSIDYVAALRGRLFTLLGHTQVVADRLKAARDACAAVVEEYQSEIIAAKDQLLRELSGDAGDPLAALLDLNPTTALLTVYESAVVRMNTAIEHTAIVGLDSEPDGESIRARLRRSGLADDGVMDVPLDLAVRLHMPPASQQLPVHGTTDCLQQGADHVRRERDRRRPHRHGDAGDGPDRSRWAAANGGDGAVVGDSRRSVGAGAKFWGGCAKCAGTYDRGHLRCGRHVCGTLHHERRRGDRDARPRRRKTGCRCGRNRW